VSGPQNRGFRRAEERSTIASLADNSPAQCGEVGLGRRQGELPHIPAASLGWVPVQV
jgi:hypothetical protein